VLQTAVSLINLGGRRAGLAPGSEDERDLAQVELAIEGVRALMPLIERSGLAGPQELAPLRDAVAQLQLAYARLRSEGDAPAGGEGEGPPGPGGAGTGEGAAATPGKEPGGKPEQPGGPAQSSGRLWVPGR
jgi:hypothetical protein